MSPVNSSNASYAMTQVYHKYMKHQMKKKIILLALATASGKVTHYAGNYVYRKVEHTDVQSDIMTDGATAFPSPGNSSGAEFRISLAHHQGTIGIDLEVMERLNADPAGFVREMDRQVQSLVRARKRKMNVYAYRGGEGYLAEVSSTTTAVTIQVISTRNLQVGMKLDVVRSGAVALTDKTIVSVDSAVQITVDSSSAVQDGDYLVIYDSNTIAPKGLQYLIATSGTMHNVSRTGNYWLHGNVVENSGSLANLDTDKLQLLVTQILERGEEMFTVGLCTPDVLNAYVKSMTADKRFIADGSGMVSFDIGFHGAYCYGAFLIADPDCVDNEIFLLNHRDLVHYPIRRLQHKWITSGNGDMFFLAPDGSGSHLPRWHCYNMHSDQWDLERPNQHGRLTNVNGLSQEA